jgi:hypothetical protein
LIPASAKKFFSSPQRAARQWRLLSFLSNGTGGSFPEVDQQDGETDHAFTSSADVKNAWSCMSSPPIRFHDVVHREFTFCNNIQQLQD